MEVMVFRYDIFYCKGYTSLGAVKKGHSQVETIGMMQQQQGVILDWGRVSMMPNIKHPRGC